MKASVYLETTIVSYLTSLPSRDIILAAEQEITREWWEKRATFDLYISEFVIDEAAAGDPIAAARRIDALRDIALLDVNPTSESLARDLIHHMALPKNAAIDALHIAISAVHGVHYLLTWNCTHIANATMRGKIEEVCRAAGFEPPIICTPMELIEG